MEYVMCAGHVSFSVADLGFFLRGSYPKHSEGRSTNSNLLRLFIYAAKYIFSLVELPSPC